jgi:hypothetical protein
MNVFPFILLIVPSVSGTITAGFRAFSGLSLNIQVGTPPQKLLVGAAFKSAETFLYAPWECPAFVYNCFDPEKSESLEARNSDFSNEKSEGTRQGHRVTDKMMIGLHEVTEFPFTLVTMNEPADMSFRDVNGGLGFGKNGNSGRSRFLDAEYIQIRHLENDQYRLDTSLGNDGDKTVFTESKDPVVWDLNGNLLLRDMLVVGNQKIIFDPVVQDIQIPFTLARKIVSAIKRQVTYTSVYSGRLFVGCQFGVLPVASLEFTVEFPDSGSQIKFDGERMGIPVEEFPAKFFPESGNYPLCATRILISEDEDSPIIIGRLLLMAVNSIVLDYKNHRFGYLPLNPIPPLFFSPIRSVQSNIPVFGKRHTFIEEPYPHICFFSVQSEGMYLLSQRAHTVEDEEGRVLRTCWNFLSKDQIGHNKIEYIRGTYESVGMRLTGAEVDIYLQKNSDISGESFRISVRILGKRFSVCFEDSEGAATIPFEHSVSARRMHEQLSLSFQDRQASVRIKGVRSGRSRFKRFLDWLWS